MCIELMDIVTQYKMISMRQCERVSEAGVEHVVALHGALKRQAQTIDLIKSEYSNKYSQQITIKKI